MLVACLVATGIETFRLSVVDCGRLWSLAILLFKMLVTCLVDCVWSMVVACYILLFKILVVPYFSPTERSGQRSDGVWGCVDVHVQDPAS